MEASDAERLEHIRAGKHDRDSDNENAFTSAGVAELADAADSKSVEGETSCGFDSHLRQWRESDE